MKDTLKKLRALLDMKGHLIEALRIDVAHAAGKIDVLQDNNAILVRQNKQLIQRLQIIEDEQRLLLKDNQDLLKHSENLVSKLEATQAALDDAQWWKALDDEMSRKEAEERADEIKHHIEIEVQNAEDAAAQELDEDIPF